jgi:hypothetical protein
VQLIEDHKPQVGEQERAIRMAQQKRELFRRGQQDIRRRLALALALGDGRVTAAGFDRDVQAHLSDRRRQVARDVDGQGL